MCRFIFLETLRITVVWQYLRAVAAEWSDSFYWSTSLDLLEKNGRCLRRISQKMKLRRLRKVLFPSKHSPTLKRNKTPFFRLNQKRTKTDGSKKTDQNGPKRTGPKRTTKTVRLIDRRPGVGLDQRFSSPLCHALDFHFFCARRG